MQNLKALVKRCIAGNAKSQKILYDRYAPKMMSLCARYARNDGEAADILQEGFVKVFLKLKNLKEPERLESWIRGVMVNTALETIRSQKSRLGFEVDLHDNHDPGEDESITGELTEEELLRLIQELPEGYRMIFNMYAIEGFNHTEIGKKLNINPGTSKSQYARAKKLLQEKVNSMYKEKVNS